MRAYRLLGPGHAELLDVDEPRPGPGEALLGVLAAGVCRTDLALVRSGAAALPVTLGHEIVGEVLELGHGVDAPTVGARVAVYELIGCGRCTACGRGEDNVCREVSPAVPGVTRDGGMAQRVAVPARNLVDIGGLDPVAAAPLTDAGMTALHAIERARPWLAAGATVVVIGVGGLGHLALQILDATTEAVAVAVDVDAARLELARRLGAAHGVLAGDGAAERVLDANAGRRVDVVLDFVGAQETLDLAAAVTGRGGAIIVVGGGGGRLCLDIRLGAGGPVEREVMAMHTFGGSRADLRAALALAAAGRIRSEVQTFGLEEAGRALDALAAGRVLGRAVIVPCAPR